MLLIALITSLLRELQFPTRDNLVLEIREITAKAPNGHPRTTAVSATI